MMLTNETALVYPNYAYDPVTGLCVSPSNRGPAWQDPQTGDPERPAQTTGQPVLLLPPPQTMYDPSQAPSRQHHGYSNG